MNLKTTLAGVGTIMVAVGSALKAIFDGDPTTNVDMGATIAAITAGVGLIAARDAKPTGPTLPPPVEPKP